MQSIDDDGSEEDHAAVGDGDELEYEAENDEIVTIQCPYCRKPIWEESVACEHCGVFISREDAPLWRPWWLIVGVVAGLLCVWLWISRG